MAGKKGPFSGIHPERRGQFTQWCKQHGFNGVTMGCIMLAKKIASKTKNRTLMGQAEIARRVKYGDLKKYVGKK